MTGGQMAPTTLLGQKTKTTPAGRKASVEGHPLKVSEMLATLDGTTYIERVAVNTPGHVKKAAKAIKKAFQVQLENKGFSLIEVLATCPTNWGMSPLQANQWIEDKVQLVFPLGIYKDTIKES
jgi:2-oxoglutarate ferredoxin oxidoreductase subunit beta